MSNEKKSIFNIIYIAATLLSTIIIGGCHNGNSSEMLLRAEKFLPLHTDSADILLAEYENKGYISKNDTALYFLLRAMTNMYYQRKADGNEISKAYEYYRNMSKEEEESDSLTLSRYARSSHYLALFLSETDSSQRCEELLRHAIAAAEKCGDLHTCYIACDLAARLIRTSNGERSVELRRKALELCERCNDNAKNKLYITLGMGYSFVSAWEPDSAIAYYKKGLALAEQESLPDMVNKAIIEIANSYGMKGDNQTALYYAEKAVLGKSVDEYNDDELRILARCYRELDSLEHSKELYKRLAQYEKFSTRYVAMRYLSEIAIKQGDLESAILYSDSAYEYSEDMFFEALEQKEYFYRMHLETEEQKLRDEAEHTNNIVILSTSTTLIIVILIFLSLYIRKRTMLERQKRLTGLMREKATIEAHIHECQMNESRMREKEKDLEAKNKLLHQKCVTLSILKRKINGRLEHIKDEIENENMDISSEVWKEIEELMKEADTEFMEHIASNNPPLKEKDIHLAILVRLKISNSAIGKIYNIGISAVKKRKLKIKKEYFNVSDPDISLEQIIESI